MLTLKDPTLLKGQCYVNGAWIGDAATPVDNPATGEVLAKVPNLGAAETTAAVEAAEAAFKPWAGSSPRSARRSSGSGLS